MEFTRAFIGYILYVAIILRFEEEFTDLPS